MIKFDFWNYRPPHSEVRQQLLESAEREQARKDEGRPIALLTENVLLPDETTRYTGIIATGQRSTAIVDDAAMTNPETTNVKDASAAEKLAAVKARLQEALIARRDAQIALGAPTQWGLAPATESARGLISGAIQTAQRYAEQDQVFRTRFTLMDGSSTPVFSGVEEIQNYGLVISQFVSTVFAPFTKVAEEVAASTNLFAAIAIAKRENLL